MSNANSKLIELDNLCKSADKIRDNFLEENIERLDWRVIAQSNKIIAVKLYNRKYGTSLREAYDIVSEFLG